MAVLINGLLHVTESNHSKAFDHVTSDGPMVRFSEGQAKGRRSDPVGNVVDFLFLLLSLNWIDISFLYVKSTLNCPYRM